MKIYNPHFAHFLHGLRAFWLLAVAVVGFSVFAQKPVNHPVVHTPLTAVPDSIGSVATPVFTTDSAGLMPTPGELLQQAEEEQAAVDSVIAQIPDSVALAVTSATPDEWEPREVEFVPDPTKACWMSALFPGLGQVYNRRYWKLPIVVGGYLGLAYATSWNNSMLKDYTKAYADLLDNDPETRSYMDLFNSNVTEESLDRSWLQNVLKSRKNYFRRNRDLCIICMVGVYLLAMVDAYVDASLSHFDITPDLSMDVAPALMRDARTPRPSVGLVWAINF